MKHQVALHIDRSHNDSVWILTNCKLCQLCNGSITFEGSPSFRFTTYIYTIALQWLATQVGSNLCQAGNYEDILF